MRELATPDNLLPDVKAAQERFQKILAFQTIVQQQLREGHDYGSIPGTGNKPTLLKPGAEKIIRILGVTDHYEVEATEDWDKPFFAYRVKCTLREFGTERFVGEGMGECNSLEAKYRWRKAERVCPACGAKAIIKRKEEYGGGWLCWPKKGGCGAKFAEDAPEILDQEVGRVPNEDVYDQVNTVLKMAKKRALVDAALSVGRLSDLFTQDLDDVPVESAPEPPETPPKAETGRKPPPAPEKPPLAQPLGGFPGMPTKKAFAEAVQKRWPDFDLSQLPGLLGCQWPEWVKKHGGDIIAATKEAWARIESQTERR